MTIILKSEKGAELTHAELDQNIAELRGGVGATVPSGQSGGIKLGPYGAPADAWHDLHSTIHTDQTNPATLPQFITYRGGIKGRAFDEGDEAFIEFHIPHDYRMGTEVFIHAHWSHNAADVSSGSVTWGFELTYAKGHNQQAFSAPILVSVAQNASAEQYQHMVAETAITSVSGSGTTFAVGQIEPDGVLMCRVYLDSNDLVTGGSTPLPFLHFVDLHYQSTNVGTLNKSPTFWG